VDSGIKMNLRILPWLALGLVLWLLAYLAQGSSLFGLAIGAALLFWIPLSIVWARMVLLRLSADR
jgi:hypothetical protein